MQKLYEVRKQHGGIFVTAFEDGLLIPWKPLPIGDYIRYNQDYHRGIIPPSVLEDEIFCKCVVDGTFLRQIKFLKAGVVTTVVLNIWQYSGPSSISSFNEDLNAARSILAADESRALNDLVQIVTMAFPYKPEEVYAMEYETFLLRVAQAEKKLLELNVIQQPIEMVDTRTKETVISSNRKTPRVDARKLWDQQQKEKRGSSKTQEQVRTQEKWWKKSPVLEASESHNINFDLARREADDLVLDNHEKRESAEMREYIINSKISESRAKMVADAREIYKDLIEEMNKRKTGRV